MKIVTVSTILYIRGIPQYAAQVDFQLYSVGRIMYILFIHIEGLNRKKITCKPSRDF